jgi:sulfur-carrier protein
MSIKITVPPALRDLTHGAVEIEGDGLTVAGLIDTLEARFPGVAARLLEPDGRLRLHVSVFVNSQDARRLQGMQTPLADGDSVNIIAAMAGG